MNREMPETFDPPLTAARPSIIFAAQSVLELAGEARSHLEAPMSAETTSRNLQSIYLGSLVYTVVSFGGNDLVTQSVLTILLLPLVILSIRKIPANPSLFFLYFIGLCCFFVFTGVAFLQSIRLDHHFLEHPIWNLVRENVGPVQGAISVSPEQTRASLVCLAPLLGFLVTISLFGTLEEAISLIRKLNYFTAIVAAYGLVQHFFFGRQLGFAEKVFYLDSLTAFFVNRNSAGAFFGIGTIMSGSVAFYYLRSIDPMKLGDKILAPQKGDAPEYRMFMVAVCLTLLQFIALLLTQSRGAIGATFLASVVLTLIMAQRKLSRGAATKTKVNIFKPYIVILFLVTGLFFLFSGQAAHRQEAGGIDYSRLCVYKSVIVAISDNWILGTGFGTFSNVFPAYRDPDCVGVSGVWEAAHNSFLEGTLGLGVVFPVITVIGFVVLIRTFWIGIKARHRYRFAPALGLAVLLLVSLHSLVDFSMQIPGVSFLVATILGCCSVVALERGEPR
jgi:hypothetical protein